MKKILNLFILTLAAVTVTSCKKYLDVNVNPNDPTTGTPDLVLPQSIVYAAAHTVNFNFYGSQTVGYLANGGGVSGWGAIISYNYATTDQTGLFNTSYDVANDIQYVIDNTEGQAQFAQYNAAAKVMKAFVFQRLVDQYNDVPYTESLKGGGNVTPKYDKATDIYKSLADLCDAAITTFNANPVATSQFKTSDPLFGSSSSTTVEINRWIQFANTLKLRLIIRAGSKVAFSNKTFDSKGFLTDDAIVNPGYTRANGKQNPMWNSYAYSFANAAQTAGAQYVPTPYIISFFNGQKISDPTRINLYYKNGSAVNSGSFTNTLGSLLATAGRGQTPNSWFKGTNATTYDQAGIFKGPDAGQPIFLAADSYFLQAEAMLTGVISGDATTAFNNGILASFTYLDKNAAGAVTGNVPGSATVARNPSAEVTAYKAANPNSYLVNYEKATTNAQRLEAIITQKYLALNFIIGDEAWNEYRRTGYPVNVNNGSSTESFTSVATESTAPDKLPTRLLYPNTEFSYNSANIPSVDKYTSKIFWAR
ncbi:SusD/RagB family nutrient-binding outer membrane lipoprotein [Mucilaginibacter sp. CSA2-8R]|uniref:SusD/RagB family nutrient-binding outer membrane lipoprotein n=1 Tax=Mucilaginibacter sp. CSA2-8R TaxID=3141542 RepID=UPI00315D7B56